MKRLIIVAAAALAAVTAGAVAAVASNDSPAVKSTLATASRNRPFQDVGAALAAATSCRRLHRGARSRSDGIHYLHPAFASDSVIDAAEPELLLYLPKPAAAWCSSGSSTSRPTPTRTCRRTATGLRSPACPSTGRCSDTSRVCRSTTTCTPGSGGTTRAAAWRSSTRDQLLRRAATSERAGPAPALSLILVPEPAAQASQLLPGLAPVSRTHRPADVRERVRERHSGWPDC